MQTVCNPHAPQASVLYCEKWAVRAFGKDAGQQCDVGSRDELRRAHAVVVQQARAVALNLRDLGEGRDLRPYAKYHPRLQTGHRG